MPKKITALIFKGFWFTFIFLVSQKSFSSYRLQNFPDFRSCPFLHEDDYAQEINRLHDLIQGFLKAKIEGHQKCNGPFNSIIQNLDNIDLLFANNRNPSLLEDINSEILSKQLLQLELDQILADPLSSDYKSVAEEIGKIKERILENEANKRFSRDYFKETKNNAVLSQTFNYMNNTINTLANLDAECIDQLGGWQQILPTILNSISSLSGLTGFAYSAIIGAGLQLISSLTILLKDVRAKTALRSLIKHKNNKLLACAYFSIQNTACEYKRAYKFSLDEKKIKDLIKQKYKDKNTSLYDEFFNLLERSRDFEEVFLDIAKMGSAISFDVHLIAKYFKARQSNPETILDEDDIGPPPDESDNSTAAEIKRQEWLIKVKERGISLEEIGLEGPKSLVQQVKDALLNIAQKISDIKAIELILGGRRSFIDIKHELDTEPHLYDQVQKYLDFFKRVLDQKVVPTERKGIVAEAIRIMSHLKEFLSIRYEEIENGSTEFIDSYSLYKEKVNEKGKLLFGIMADGAVAQISGQTILTIGRTVQQRIDRVFRLVEEEFYGQEQENFKKFSSGQKKQLGYSDYKRDRSLLVKVASSYQSFSGSSKTFRLEDVEVAMRALEKGFKREINSMLAKALSSTSKFYPDLQGETASHLCALFSSTLSKTKFYDLKTNKLYKQCKLRFKELDLMKILKPSKLAINWEDPCFYSNYRRLLKTQESLYSIMLEHGFEIDHD